jgi:L-alanine-DL-glutamate epimerase-like enolase superfamily enzyme
VQPRIHLALEPLELKLKHPFTISRATSTHRYNVLVRAAWGDHEGLGEASYTPRYEQDAKVIQRALERVVHDLDRAERSPAALREALGKLDLPSGARMGLSIALADLEAKARGIPLHALFDLPPPPPVVTSFTIGLDTKDVVAQKVREAAAFPVLKVKAGRPDDLELLEAVRELHPGPLRVDANEGWTPAEAAARLPRLKKLGIEFVEQPIKAGQYEALKRLKRESPLPVLVDEDIVTGDELEQLAGCVDGINVKLMKCGGLEKAIAIMRRAKELGMQVMIGCMIESTVGITAAAHLLALVDYADLDGHLLVTNDPYRGVSVDEGRLIVPSDRAGLGVVPAPAT